MAYVGIPPGSIFQFGGSVAPAGYLLCDGSAVSRTTYADLFASIGTTHGAGNGSTTFNLPDGKGRALVGQGTHPDVGTLGNNEGAAVGARRPKHKHSIADPGHTHSVDQNQEFLQSVDNPHNELGTVAGGGIGIWHRSPSRAVSSSSTGITVGPQTGNESTDSGGYLVVQHIIKY